MTPDELNVLFNTANEKYLSKDFSQAENLYKQVIQQTPDNYIVWHNYALSLIAQNRHEEGINSLELPIKMGYAESYLSRGAALRAIGKYQEAMADFSRCFLLEPNNAKAHSNYGNTLREFGLPHAAIPHLEKSLQLDNSDPVARLNESIAHLLHGDLISGWKNYDARWFYQSDSSFKPKLPGDEYNGTQDIKGKILCVYCEQGFGDSIQFIRYIKLLQEKGARILLITRPQLVKLFQYNFPDIDIRTGYTDLVYNYHVPLMELPKCFNTSIDTIPYRDTYLSISNNIITKYSQQLGPKTKKRVGIVWSSNAIAFITRFRQVPLEKFLKTLSECDVELINLEFDVSQEESELLNKYNVKSFEVDGFDDTAGLMKTLDLVVTVDTVYAHLAGALGLPTYVMLADYGMDWRWFLKRSDSPFYNCVELFRQHGDSKWEPVFADIKNKIKGNT